MEKLEKYRLSQFQNSAYRNGTLFAIRRALFADEHRLGSVIKNANCGLPRRIFCREFLTLYTSRRAGCLQTLHGALSLLVTSPPERSWSGKGLLVHALLIAKEGQAPLRRGCLRAASARFLSMSSETGRCKRRRPPAEVRRFLGVTFSLWGRRRPKSYHFAVPLSKPALPRPQKNERLSFNAYPSLWIATSTGLCRRRPEHHGS